MRRSRVLLGALLAATFAGVASAHGFLEHASPRVGSVVERAPAQVSLWFTQELEPTLSSVHVLDATGKQVDAKDKQVDAKDASIMRVSLPPLPPGKYRVVWRAQSVDTHAAEGDFTFEVRP